MIDALVDWFAFRLVEGMKAEERCWKIYTNFDTETSTATDLNRWSMPKIIRFPHSLDRLAFENYVKTGPGSHEEVKAYVRFRIAKAGIVFALQFWRKYP